MLLDILVGALIIIGFLGPIVLLVVLAWFLIMTPKRKPRAGQPPSALQLPVLRRGGWENKLLFFGAAMAILAFVVTIRLGTLALFISIPSLLFGSALLLYGLEKLRQRRLIQNIPTSTIRAAAIGLIEIQGTVRVTQSPLHSPIQKRPCVHYTTTVKELRRTGENDTWVTIYQASEGERLIIDDGTGSILVHLNEPDYDLDKDLDVKGHRFQDEQILRFSAENGIPLNNGRATRQLHYQETIIEPGDELYVMGTAKQDAAANDTTSKLIIERGEHESFFYISEHGEENVLKKLRRLLHIGIWGGAVLIIIGLTALINGVL